MSKIPNGYSFILSFQEVDKTQGAIVGGKGANLGELSRIEGIYVPDGFCVSTEAFRNVVEETPLINNLLEQLSLLHIEERGKINELSYRLRNAIEESAIPYRLNEEVTRSLLLYGEKDAYAIRSSATAEDLPIASFAGQQETYLNITGKEAILKHISKCWASLFTDRAVTYRIQNGYGHRNVLIAVVVQKMVFPQVAGVMFTADPITSNRKVLSIDASFGLGEALVSGLVNADNYKVSNGEITHKKISAKKRAVYAIKEGGTKEYEIMDDRQNMQSLTDGQILRLEQIGKKIEKHFGHPQDIEWCLGDDVFYIVQSRPITTLYPVPEADDEKNHVYISVGHQQMMTDPMKPLGLSLWQQKAFRPMYEAGGRLFVDVADQLSTSVGREMLLQAMGQHDPLIKDALKTIIERGDFIKTLPDNSIEAGAGENNMAAIDPKTQIETNPAVVSELIKRSQATIEALKQNIQMKSGPELFDFIRQDNQNSKNILFDKQNMFAIRTAVDTSIWVNEKMNEWLGEKNVADILSQSAPNNVTSEMGLALLDVADVIRPYPEVIAYLENAKDDNFMVGMLKLDGGQKSHDAIAAYLDKYGMRCVGEIDITRPRWSEKPSVLIPVILNNIKNFAPNAGKQRFEQGLYEASKKEQELLKRLAQLPDGEQKAQQAKQMISLMRSFIGYREYPKYIIVSHYLLYKKSLLKEAEKLVQAGIIQEKEDVYYLTFNEFHEAVCNNKVDYEIISKRKNEYRIFKNLTPPRVITSDGEIITGTYKSGNLPAGAIAGLAVSSGIIEGRARVVHNMEDANLEDGDILVTSFTDPSWTPLFVSIKGLVTEVGGLMTHGAVIAREYGLPAIVGVENATSIIKDGQIIRVNGTDGYIELL